MPQPEQKLQKAIESLTGKIICGDSLKVLKKIPDESIDCVVTSPPYWALRDYGVRKQIGLEENSSEYLDKLLLIFDEVKRVLKRGGTCWVNIGDTYSAKEKAATYKRQEDQDSFLTKKASLVVLKNVSKIPAKSLCLIPSRFALGMIGRGWILRNEIIWHKPNAIPSSVKDRFTVDFEKVFFFVKSRKYYFTQQFEPLTDIKRLSRRFRNPDHKYKYEQSEWHSINPNSIEKSRQKIIQRGKRNKRCVWAIGTINFTGQHFAPYPPRLIETPIKAGCPKGGIVLDPFIGSGTTAVVAKELGRQFIGIELKAEYAKLARNRLKKTK